MLTGAQHHHIDKVLRMKDKLGRIYSNLVLQSFALSLVSIFVPIYLLTIGFSLTKVFVYLLIEWTVFGLLTPLYAKIIGRVGLKEVIFIRTPITAVALLLLNAMQDSVFLQTYFFIVPMLKGLAGSLYTISIHSLFARNIGTTNQADKTSKSIALPRLVSMVGPLIGGLIVSLAGFQGLFILVTVLLFLSLIPLTYINERVDHPNFILEHYKQFFRKKKDLFYNILYGAIGFMPHILLPLAIYLIINNTTSLGALTTLTALGGTILMIGIGKITDRYGLRRPLHIGAILTTILFILFGAFVQSTTLLYLSLLAGAVFAFIIIPYETHLFRRAHDLLHPIEYVAFKESALFIGRLAMFIVAIALSGQIESLFYIGAAAAFLFVLY